MQFPQNVFPDASKGSQSDCQARPKGPKEPRRERWRRTSGLQGTPKSVQGSSRDAKVIPRWSSGLPKELPGTFREAQVVLRGAQGLYFNNFYHTFSTRDVLYNTLFVSFVLRLCSIRLGESQKHMMIRRRNNKSIDR